MVKSGILCTLPCCGAATAEFEEQVFVGGALKHMVPMHGAGRTNNST
jgi:hypothetical protein